jgi:hypothetical protein
VADASTAVPDAPEEPRQTEQRVKGRTVLAWIIGIAVAILAVVGMLALMNPSVGALTPAQRAHAISLPQFDALPLGPSRAEVIASLGKEPYATQFDTTTRGSRATRLQSSCIYYYRIDKPFGQGFQLCFDDGALSGKLEF